MNILDHGEFEEHPFNRGYFGIFVAFENALYNFKKGIDK
jgi:hypothetical protein